jgi:hypothetical protein
VGLPTKIVVVTTTDFPSIVSVTTPTVKFKSAMGVTAYSEYVSVPTSGCGYTDELKSGVIPVKFSAPAGITKLILPSIVMVGA